MKNVVITGSTRGLGFEMAKKFLELGCNVTISGSKPESFDNAKEKLNGFSDKYILLVMLEAKQTLETYGKNQLINGGA